MTPEIQAIPDEKFAQFLADPALAEWRISLQKIRRMKPHVLSEREERLLALGSAALDGYEDAFAQLTDVDMKFGVLVDEKGVERPLTQSSYNAFLVKRDHALRQRAFHQYYAEFQDHQFTLATALAYSVKADVFRARARNYPSALEASLFDDIPPAVYDASSDGRIWRPFSATSCGGGCSAEGPILRRLCAAGRRDRDGHLL
jgi:oligoendopeptidase F